MKKSVLLLALIISSQVAMAQNAKYPAAIALYFGTIQYNGELGNRFFKTDAGNYGAFGFSGSVYLSRFFDEGIMFTHGQVTSGEMSTLYPYYMKQSLNNINYFLKYKFYNGKILKENAYIGPYIFAGIGGSNWDRTSDPVRNIVGAYIPVGAGIRVRLCEKSDLLLQTSYLYMLSDEVDANSTKSGNDAFLHTTLGITFNFGREEDGDGDGVSDKKDKCPGTPAGVKVDANGCPPDKDGDGIADYIDQCPDVPGQASAKGCPDKDGDGVADKDDKCPDIAGPEATFGCPDKDGDGILDGDDACPDVKGLAEFKGCPDTDGDGITDKEDACPTEKGPKATKGCPDKDGDGIADKDDKCPDVAGIAANLGCPEVKEEVKKVLEQALTGLQFETGKDVIKKNSYPTMDNIVKVMNDNPVYKLSISGHTDNVGDAKKNQELSAKRAAAAAKYLTDHGIDPSRLMPAGYGDTMPVADNKTEDGRAKNRRVEFKVKF